MFFNNTFAGFDEKLSEVSNHPPHLIDSSGSLTPAALIPFCAYQTNMTLLGQTRQDLPFTVCDQFRPTLLEGQLCYLINLNMTENRKAKSGLRYGLVLILDPSEKEPENTEEIKEDITSLNFETVSNAKSSARIYLNTLASFTDYKSGSYGMFSLKKMTGMDNFLELPAEVNQCKVETFEECQAPKYIEEVQRKCGCIPWALNSTLSQKVMSIYTDCFLL